MCYVIAFIINFQLLSLKNGIIVGIILIIPEFKNAQRRFCVRKILLVKPV